MIMKSQLMTQKKKKIKNQMLNRKKNKSKG